MATTVKSVRMSDDLIELIEQQVGDTFTEKLQNLVTRCVWELPMQEEKLEQIQRQIQSERQRLRDLQTLYRKLNNIYNDLNSKTNIILQGVNRAIRELDT